MSTSQAPPEAEAPAAERPTVVYLDWNLLQDIIDGMLPDLSTDLLGLSADGAIIVPYTHQHVREASFGLGAEDTRRRKLLDGIDAITGSVLLRPKNSPPYSLCPAARVAADIDGEADTLRLMRDTLPEQMALMRQGHETILSQLDADGDERAAFHARFERILDGHTEGLGVLAITGLLMELIWKRRTALDASTGGPSRLNNMSAEAVFDALDRMSLGAGGPAVSAHLRRGTLPDSPDGTGSAGGVNAALNVTGWWRDKGVSVRSILIDGLHVDHALEYSDLFLTRDHRLHKRADAVARMRAANTRVVYFQDGMTLVRTGEPRG